MKKILMTIIAGLIAFPSLAQWTLSGSNIYNSNTGNVGIGTTSPGVYSLAVSSSDFRVASFNSTYGQMNVDFMNSGNMFASIGSGVSQSSDAGITASDFGIGTAGSATNRIIFATGAAYNTRMTILPNGNVGIGTTTPGSRLAVDGGISYGNTSTQYVNSFIDWMGAYHEAYGSTAATNQIRIQNSNRGGAAAYNGILVGEAAVASGAGIQFYTGGFNNSRMVINSSGNVGIGTDNPQGYKLAVNGNVIAESVKVALQGSWPDYVFADDYRLPPLTEVEKFIQANHHLPEMPSAATVGKEGINLGEIDAKLLKKIEELTLHLIEQDKKLEKQELLINKLLEKKSDK